MFSQIVTAIETKLASIGAWCQTIGVGDEYVEETGAPPRIVLIPREEEFRPCTGPGGNPRPLWDRHIGAEVVLWGLTQDDTEGLIDQFVIALHRALKDTSTSAHARGGSYALGKGRWDRKTNLAKYGFQYRMTVSIVVPVIDRDWSTTPMQAPDASTYTGDQILTNPRVPDGTVVAGDVAAMLGDPASAQGNATISSLPAPTLSAISPATAAAAGGATITLTGTWLEGATVTVGGTSAAVTSSAYDSLTFTMPAVAVGAHDVIASTAAGPSEALTITAT